MASDFVAMNIKGVEQLVSELRNEALRVSDKARKTMHRGADKIVKEAQLNAPVDKHNLEESIHKEKTYGDRNRLQIDIIVGGSVNGVDVDAYATEMHEHYPENHPGPGTAAKRAANPGRHVGGKFLDRAVEKQLPKLQKDLIAAATGTKTL